MNQGFTRTTFALSTALALSVALAPASAFAKGPGGNPDCNGDCSAEQPQVQKQARDGSGGGGQQSATKAAAGGGGNVQARNGSRQQTQPQQVQRQQVQDQQVQTRQGTQKQVRNVKSGTGQGPSEDGERGPGTCDDCLAEMGTLTDDQAAGLLYMANEEKLARDVYAYFAEKYGMRIFSNIAESESMHQQAVNVVLERYGLQDTAISRTAGQFSDPAIADLYAKLIEQGSVSLEDAIAVGVLIEQTDIADLESRLEGLEETAPDVYEMYSHLLAASQNHLAAFESWL